MADDRRDQNPCPYHPQLAGKIDDLKEGMSRQATATQLVLEKLDNLMAYGGPLTELGERTSANEREIKAAHTRLDTHKKETEKHTERTQNEMSDLNRRLDESKKFGWQVALKAATIAVSLFVGLLAAAVAVFSAFLTRGG